MAYSHPDMIGDIRGMHDFYEFTKRVAEFDKDQLKKLLEFRKNFLREEMAELDSSTTAEDVVDALVDIIVVALGTLDTFGVDTAKAWIAVHNANMRKAPGVKPSRPNPLNLPDLIKPFGWCGPSHMSNHGMLEGIFS
jgi:predicted HAD superfamily Cof-like phosphohydrolase